MRVTVHFCKGRGLGAQLLRLFLMSRWNHVAIQIGGVVYESVLGGGVIRHPAHSFASRWERVSSVDADVVDVTALLAFLDGQLGKPYDWRAILAFPFRGELAWPESVVLLGAGLRGAENRGRLTA